MLMKGGGDARIAMSIFFNNEWLYILKLISGDMVGLSFSILETNAFNIIEEVLVIIVKIEYINIAVLSKESFCLHHRAV